MNEHAIRITELRAIQAAALDDGHTDTWVRMQQEIRELETTTTATGDGGSAPAGRR